MQDVTPLRLCDALHVEVDREEPQGASSLEKPAPSERSSRRGALKSVRDLSAHADATSVMSALPDFDGDDTLERTRIMAARKSAPAPEPLVNRTLLLRTMPDAALPTPECTMAMEAIAPAPDHEKSVVPGGAVKALLAKLGLSRRIVSAYRIFGFGILTSILFGLVAFVSTHLFFLTNHSWGSPAVLSPTDPRVLQLSSHYTQEAGQRDELVAQRLELEVRKHDAERVVAAEIAFQAAYVRAVTADLADRKAELGRFRGLLGSYDATRRSVSATKSAFGAASKERLKAEYDAHVIDKDRMLGGQLQLAQMAESNLSLGSQHIEIEGRTAALARQVSALETSLTAGSDQELSYDVLKIKQELDHSVLVAQKAAEELGAATKSIDMLGKTIAMKEDALHKMEGSAYMLAANAKATFAFVPYENTGSLSAGQKVYACAAAFIFCREVGRVERVLDGEITGKHPLLHQDLRGIFVTLALDDEKAAKDMVLHLGRKPLFL